MSGPGKSAAEIQRDSDVIELTATIHRVKMRIGAERFAAALANLPDKLQPKMQGGPAAAAVQPAAESQRSPSPGPGVLARDAAPPVDDGSDTLALARAAGIGRFAVAEEGRSPAAAKPEVAEVDTLALIRASGLKGYNVGRCA